MKTLHISCTIMLSLGAIFPGTNVALSQEMQSTQGYIQFIPLVPTENSNVTAIIRVFSLDIYCANYTIDHLLSGHDLVLNIRTRANPAERCPMPSESDIFLKQSIGKLGFGTFDVKLLINGTQKATTKLYISQRGIEIISSRVFMAALIWNWNCQWYDLERRKHRCKSGQSCLCIIRQERD